MGCPLHMIGWRVHQTGLLDQYRDHTKCRKVRSCDTCTADFIHQILYRQNIAQDHYPNCQYIHRKTVTNVQTLPQTNNVSHPNPNHDPVHGREKLTNIETLPQRINVRDHNPIHGREKLTNIETLSQRNNVRDHDPIHGREKLTNIVTLPQRNNLRDPDRVHCRETVDKRRDTSPKEPYERS